MGGHGRAPTVFGNWQFPALVKKRPSVLLQGVHGFGTLIPRNKNVISIPTKHASPSLYFLRNRNLAHQVETAKIGIPAAFKGVVKLHITPVMPAEILSPIFRHMRHDTDQNP